MDGDFGFDCGVFSVALAADGIIIPGGKSAPLRKSYVPYMSADQSAGMFTLRATSGENVICDLPVHVMWVTHHKEPEPFIGRRIEYRNYVWRRNTNFTLCLRCFTFSKRTHKIL